MNEVQARLKGARLSAQKARLVADQIRGKHVEEALNTLAFSTKKAAHIMKKVLESAIANAEHNDGADVDTLRVTTVFVDEGTTLKRIMPRAKVAQTGLARGHAISLSKSVRPEGRHHGSESSPEWHPPRDRKGTFISVVRVWCGLCEQVVR